MSSDSDEFYDLDDPETKPKTDATEAAGDRGDHVPPHNEKYSHPRPAKRASCLSVSLAAPLFIPLTASGRDAFCSSPGRDGTALSIPNLMLVIHQQSFYQQ